MQTPLIERMEPGNPDSLYRAEIGGRKIEGLTYQEAIAPLLRELAAWLPEVFDDLLEAMDGEA